MMHLKDFDKWNFEKKQLNEAVHADSFYIHEREIWWTSIGVNVGTEIDGKNEKFERPVLVLRKLGKEQFIGIPITSKSKTGTFYHNVTYGDGQGTACISQIRVFSSNRLLRKIGRIASDDFISLCKTLSQLILTGKI